jgi:hypothetical protein
LAAPGTLAGAVAPPAAPWIGALGTCRRVARTTSELATMLPGGSAVLLSETNAT